MIKSVWKSPVRQVVFWTLFSLFAFTTLAHDSTCHEEPAGLCQALHQTWADTACLQPDSFLELRPLGAWLTWNNDPLILPDFIKYIFHPPN